MKFVKSYLLLLFHVFVHRTLMKLVICFDDDPH